MSPNWVDTVIDVLNRLPSSSRTAHDSRENNYITLEKVDSVEYDSVHLWECQIDGAPSPFDKWFPAQTVDEPSKGASVAPMSFGIEEVNMLNSYNALNLRTELIDDANATLERWLRDWQKNISVDKYYGFRYPEQILRKMYITKYNWQKDKIYTHEYVVIPVGDINMQHGNEPALKVINVNFAVFGKSEV